MSIDHGKVLEKLTLVAQAIKPIKGLQGMGETINEAIRALAQPAEAVDTGALTNLLSMLRDRESAALYGWPRWFDMCADELDSFLISTGSVQDSSAPQRFESEATTGPHSQTAAISGNCTGPTHDAAQGAVAWRFFVGHSNSWLFEGWTGWTTDAAFRELCERQGFRAEFAYPANHPQAAPAQGDGVSLIAAERRRQIEAEGWTPEHDDEHAAGELSRAAGCYALAYALHQLGESREAVPAPWPWDHEWWKPTWDARQLVKAGALIAAEIDRLQRTAAPSQEGGASRFIGFVSVHWRDDLARDDVVSVSATLDGSHSLPVYLSASPSQEPQ